MALKAICPACKCVLTIEIETLSLWYRLTHKIPVVKKWRHAKRYRMSFRNFLRGLFS